MSNCHYLYTNKDGIPFMVFVEIAMPRLGYAYAEVIWAKILDGDRLSAVGLFNVSSQ
ncbi:hypothetical protein ACEYW6_19975 [Nostoc sp. UIC 10607]|uniref:hypothetical protein n=1 Tax=Nostoc sp. UIC 10607 TaxID=3045935 RepID=UPI0039A34901